MPEHEGEQQSSIIPIEKLSDVELTEGGQIEGIKNAEELNFVLTQLAGSLLQRWYPEEEYIPGKSYPSNHPYRILAIDLKRFYRGIQIAQTVAEMLERDANKIKHNGHFGHYKILPTQPDTTLLHRQDVQREKELQSSPNATGTSIYPDSSMTFFVSQALLSGGQGEVGEIVRKCNMYVRSSNLLKDYPFRIGFTSIPVKTSEAKKTLTQHREQSAERWRQVMAEGFRKAYRAGLPTLGKKR